MKSLLNRKFTIYTYLKFIDVLWQNKHYINNFVNG